MAIYDQSVWQCLFHLKSTTLEAMKANLDPPMYAKAPQGVQCNLCARAPLCCTVPAN